MRICPFLTVPTGVLSSSTPPSARKSGEPYIIHPLAVSQILADLGMGPIVAAAGLLHDTVEDTDYTLDQCRAEFATPWPVWSMALPS